MMTKYHTRKRLYLLSVGFMILFAAVGSFFADRIGLESEAGQFWDYESRLPGIGVNLTISCAATFLIYLIVRYFPLGAQAMKILAWILGIVAGVWMLFVSGYYLCLSSDPTDVYGAAGLWISYVDKREVEKTVWDKSHWLGRGDDVYETGFQQYLEAKNHLYLGNEGEEPYHSIVDERERIEFVFRLFQWNTMINVLSYCYGKWVWLLYLTIAVLNVGLALSLLRAAETVPGRMLYLSAWILGTVFSLIPVLGGCGFVYAPCGPPFTGYGPTCWGLNVLTAGIAYGVILGIMQRKTNQTLSNETGEA